MKRIWMCVGALLLSGCASQPAVLEKSGFFLDTTVSISLYDTRDEAILNECFRQISNFEKMFSRTIEGSDTDRLNRAGGEPVTVSADTAALLDVGLAYGKKTDGALDITIAPASRLWAFAAANPAPPDPAALREAVTHVGYAGLTLRGNVAVLADPLAGVDLGAVAKGYITDRLVDFLRERGVKSAMINLGGNLYALGDKNGKPFTVGIRDPGDENALAATIRAQDCSVVTSGTYERCFTVDGVRYHHLLDPRTGMPAQSGLASVTIVSPRSVDGDALSTSCFVLGAEKGLALIDSLENTEALFLLEDGTKRYSQNFRAKYE